MLSAVEKKSDQVYRWLLAYIDENKFSGNQRLPSENALCRKLGVSRETIRVAIDQLVAEGLVYKLKGSGTYFHREKVMTRDLNTDDALYKIGLVLQGQDTSANSGLIEGVRSVLTQEQVDLHVFLTDNKFCNERRCLETVVHQNFHGFIVDGVKSSILSPNLDCYKELYRRKIPVIFYNNFYRNLRCPRVTINDIECAHQLIGRLIDAGHSHIAGIFVYDNYQSVEKFQGMAEAMRNRGLELNDDYIKWCISDEAHNESYVRSIERFLKSIPKCTAIVCCNYIIYRLVMKTLQKMGKTVPEDYSLVCFDYSEETYRQEDVTCSVEQGFEMGRQLALRLMEMISTGECDDRNYTYVMKPIQTNAIGLDAVEHRDIALHGTLRFQKEPEEIQPGKSRFAALKQKMDAAAFLCGCKSLFNQFSCHFMGKQSHIFAGSAVGNIVIKAVPATQIAQAGRWLDEKCIMFHRDSLRASQFLKQGYRKIRAFASSNS